MAMKEGENTKPFLFALLIAMASLIIGVLPYLSRSVNSLFFNMDPDPMYIGNALQLLQTGRVFFMDHPGTPLISLIAFSYLPIKIYVDFFLHISNFAVYFFQHLDFVYLYTRTLMLGVYFIGIFLFHFVLYKKYKSILVNIFFGSMLFLDPMHIGMYWGITPEVLAFTLTATWFYLINKYDETNNVKFILIGSFLTGVIFATKMSFLFVTPATFLYLYFKYGGNLKGLTGKGILFLRSAVFAATGFLLGIFPLWYKLREVVSYISSYFFHTGKMGGGEVGLLSLGVFRNSLLGMFTHPLILIIFLLFVFQAINLLKKEVLVKSVLISGTLGLFAFMKYTDFHYQTANILLAVLAASVIFAKLPVVYKSVILAILLVFFADSVQQNFKARRQIVSESYYLQNFLDSKKVPGKIVWEYARARDYSALRSVEWSGFSLLEDFNTAFPNTLYLDWRDLSKIAAFPYKPGTPLNSVCWKILVLQGQSWDNFIRAQKDPAMYIKEDIPGTGMLSVTYRNSLNCRVKKNK